MAAYYAIKEAVEICPQISYLAVIVDNISAVTVFNHAVQTADPSLIYSASPNLRHKITAALVPLIHSLSNKFTSLIAHHVPSHTKCSDDLSLGNHEADRLTALACGVSKIPNENVRSHKQLHNPLPGTGLEVTFIRDS